MLFARMRKYVTRRAGAGFPGSQIARLQSGYAKHERLRDKFYDFPVLKNTAHWAADLDRGCEHCQTSLLTIGIALCLAFFPFIESAISAADPAVANPSWSVDLWPEGKMPGHGASETEQEKAPTGDGVQRIINVSRPTLSIFRVSSTTVPTPAVLVCPGGGYAALAFNLEGTEVAGWLNSIGITAVVLKYRVPDNRDGAFQDIQRAMRSIRFHAAEWGIDPERLGVIGFSAGGHLAARLAGGFGQPAYAPIDIIDKTNCRPDFAVLIYPAYLNSKKDPTSELNLITQMPPILLIHTEDDLTFLPGSKAFDQGLTRAGVPHDMLLYPTGGHGYGLRCSKDARVWPQDATAWLWKIGVLLH